MSLYFFILSKFALSEFKLNFFFTNKRKYSLYKKQIQTFYSFFIPKYTLISSSAKANDFSEKKTAWNLSKLSVRSLHFFFPSLFCFKLFQIKINMMYLL